MALDAIKGYVMCALMASAIAGILKNVSSGMRNFEKYIGFVCSLVVVIMLATPFVLVVSEIEELLSDEYYSEAEDDDKISDEENTDFKTKRLQRITPRRSKIRLSR